MTLQIVLNPAVVIANRIAGSFGIGEIVNLSCAVSGPTTVAGLGGVTFKIVQGSGTIAAANVALGTAVFTASTKAEVVKIAAYGVNNQNAQQAVAGLTIVAPTGLKFVKNSNVFHTNGLAVVGFRADVFLQSPGVSYQRLEIREGEFKSVAQGYFARDNGLTHPASGAALGIANGNQMIGNDTISSGPHPAPWSNGKFEWNIPWQWRIVGTAAWTTFAYANHVTEINAMGAVTVAKLNEGPFSAKPSDPTQAY
jgi:hypothetical protein